jgi:hypothetical protein
MASAVVFKLSTSPGPSDPAPSPFPPSPSPSPQPRPGPLPPSPPRVYGVQELFTMARADHIAARKRQRAGLTKEASRRE